MLAEPARPIGHAGCKNKLPSDDKLGKVLIRAKACREFVICIISEWFLEAANHTCGEYDKGCNEMELAGLTPEPSYKVGLHRCPAMPDLICQLAGLSQPAWNNLK